MKKLLVASVVALLACSCGIDPNERFDENSAEVFVVPEASDAGTPHQQNEVAASVCLLPDGGWYAWLAPNCPAE